MPVTINGSNTPTAGGVTYGDGTQYATTTAGTTGQALLSGGAGAPTWGTPASSTTATNLAGGSAGTVPYQSASGTTQMLAAGTSGQVLTSSGAGAPSWTTPATSAPPTQQRFTASGSATWTKPSGCKTIFVQLVGGGGNGNNYWGTPGGYSQKWIDVTAVSSVAVTVGAGATTAGGTGGTTSFGAYLSATGGSAEVSAGIGSGGDLNIRGTGKTYYQGGYWGTAGSTPMGTGSGIDGNSINTAASGYGGGGFNLSGYFAGGGAVFVTEYY